MRKEVIIGLTVIVALTITFGVVLAKRLGDSPDVATGPPAPQHGDDSDATPNAPGKGSCRRQAAFQLGQLQRVADPHGEACHRRTRAILLHGKWSVPHATRRRQQAGRQRRTVDLPPAPMMPKPSASTWAGANDRRTDDVQQPVGSRPSPLRPADTAAASSSQPYDPFPTPPSPPATAYAGQANYTPTGFKAPDVSTPNPHHSTAGYGYSDEAGYSGTSSSAATSGSGHIGLLGRVEHVGLLSARWRSQGAAGGLASGVIA